MWRTLEKDAPYLLLTFPLQNSTFVMVWEAREVEYEPAPFSPLLESTCRLLAKLLLQWG